MEASLKSGELFVAVLRQLKNKMFNFVIKEEKQRANVSVLSHGPWSHSESHNVTEQEKDEGDLQYLLHGASDLTKKKVKFTEYQLIERMMVFLKYKSRNMLRFVRSKGGYPCDPREVFHTIHPLAPREEEGDPHSSGGGIHAIQGR